MKMKIFPILMVVVLLLSVCVAGCKKAETQAPAVVVDENSITIIGGENQGSDLSEGSFSSSGQTDSEKSNAKELGGSATLNIEYPEDETKPEQGDTSATEPQWQPGIW